MPNDRLGPRAEVLRGTLEMLALKLLSQQPMHGWGLSLKLREISHDVFDVNQGSLYPALQAMLRRGWIRAEWRASENNRRARYYHITTEGANSSTPRSRNGTARRPPSTACFATLLQEPDMAWYHEIASSLASLVRRRHQDSEMDEEMRFHLEMEARRRAGEGMPEREAQRCARGAISAASSDTRTTRATSAARAGSSTRGATCASLCVRSAIARASPRRRRSRSRWASARRARCSAS